MANAWGELTWNAGLWGEQSNAIATPTGLGLNTSQGQANYTPVDGWGRFDWGSRSWGVNFTNQQIESGSFPLTLSQGNVSIDFEVNEGWGRLTWGENAWGGTGDVIVTGNQLGIYSPGNVSFTIDGVAFLTGQQLNTSLNSVTAFGLAIIQATGQQLNISEGEVDIAPDANVTGQQLNISLGSPLSYNNEGWGRYVWGEEVWGGNGIWAFAPVTGQQLNISLNSITPIANANVDLTGQQLNITEGEVDPGPDANVVGIGMTVGLAIGTVVIGTGNVALTGQQINIAQGTVEATPNTIASVTGIGLNIAVGTVFAGGTSIIQVTGNGLTIALNSINNQIWTEINTGTDATWIEIDTAA
jgi:hypothetical protein